MKCIECSRLDLRTFQQHAKTGFGRCSDEKLPGVFESIVHERQCERFVAADAETVAKRLEWWAKV